MCGEQIPSCCPRSQQVTKTRKMLLTKTTTISKNNGQLIPSVADEMRVLQGKGQDWAWHWGVSSIAKGQDPSCWKQEEKLSQCNHTKSKAMQLHFCCQEEEAHHTRGGIHSCVPALCPLPVYHPHLKPLWPREDWQRKDRPPAVC